MHPAEPLIGQYDTALFDLDGVIYLGPVAVPAAPPTMDELRARRTRVGFVTNNAGRRPETVAEHLRELGIDADASDVVTSAQAVAHLLADRFPPGSPVLVLGAESLVHEVTTRAGLRIVDSADDGPVAVVQGLNADMTWRELCDAAAAIHAGAAWYATNTDTTRPTPRGNLPGCGAAVQAMQLAVEPEPIVAGKPYPPLMVETLERLGGKRSIFVGDRLDTDVAGANAVGIDSLMVLSGAHGPAELLAAPAELRPTHLGRDVSALLEPARTVELTPGAAVCGDQRVELADGRYRWSGSADSPYAWLDVVRALTQLHWAEGTAAGAAPGPLLDQLGPMPQEVLQ